MAHSQQQQSGFMQFLGSPGGAAAIGGVSSLFGNLAGLIGGKSELEKLQEAALKDQNERNRVGFSQRQGLFQQAGGLFGRPAVSFSRFNALFNQANQGEIARIGQSLRATGIGNASPVAASTFAFLTGGARARGMFNLFQQDRRNDINLLGLQGNLTRS